VLKAAETLGYTPNTIARGLVMQKSHTIGLVVTDIENPYFGSVTRCIAEYIRNKGYNLILSVSNDILDLEEEILLNFIRNRVDGVVIVPVLTELRKDFTVFESLTRYRIPHVFATSFYPGLESHVVMADLEEGSYRMTKYLLDLGHRDIFLFTTEDPEVIPSTLRINGYLKAFHEARITPQQEFLVRCNRPNFFNGHVNAKRLLTQERPDAIMAINDILALGIKKAAIELGYTIPDDLSIAGYDDVIFSSISQTPLTTVRQKIPEICAETVRTLMSLIENTSYKTHHTLIPTELIVRKSTGIRR
jgi:LacI family transcriptional regulator